MTHHLDDTAFERLASGGPVSAEDRQHLDDCLVCRREMDVFMTALADEHQNLVDQEPDWDAQRRAILAQLPGASVTPIRARRQWIRHAMAAAAMVVVAVGVGWLVRPDGDIPSSPAIDTVPIEEILATTDTLLADDGIPGLGLIDPFAESEVDFDLLLDGENS